MVSPIGAGGMGEVYRARDTRLDRTVAVKILPSHLASDPQLRERFEREARAVSALDHQNICALYDVGEHEGMSFLVMQFLEGETLEVRLTKGPLPLDQALRYGVEIADALDRAHRAGIVHRDLKPGNVMLTKAGSKLLDFGLAKSAGSSVGIAGLSVLPTTPPGLTAQGTILGTLQYMAPEQLEGREADARTDIFAFGLVLFEMVTGRKAFEAKSQASLISAILRDDPPAPSSLQPVAPRALDRLVRICLAKDPDDRWQSARDLQRELAWIAASPADAANESGDEHGNPRTAAHLDRRCHRSRPVICRRRVGVAPTPQRGGRDRTHHLRSSNADRTARRLLVGRVCAIARRADARLCRWSWPDVHTVRSFEKRS